MPGPTLRHFCVHTLITPHMEPRRGSLFTTSLPRRGAHAPRRGLTHVWPPANLPNYNPKGIADNFGEPQPTSPGFRQHNNPEIRHTPQTHSQDQPPSAGGTRGTLGRRPYMCKTPTWASAKYARSRWGQHTHTYPYLTEVTCMTLKNASYSKIL